MKKNKRTLIEKYLAGRCTALESREVERLLETNDEEAISYLDQSAALLDSTETIVNTDLEKIWENVDATIEEVPVKSIFNLLTPLKIAAAIFIMVVSSFVLFSFFDQEAKNEEAVSTVVKHTKRGENLTVRLPDGTMVRLNSSSTITYSQSLILADQRVVELQGEAFFEVKRDEYRPFIVKTRGVNTTVLGTSFNVNAKKDDLVKVAVVTGKVSVEQGQEKVVLTPGDMAIVDEKVGKATFDFDEEIGWKNGVLVLKANDFMEVLDDIEQWYGVDIEVQGKIGEHGINVKYSNESLEEVLEGLSFAAHFNYVINDKKVKLIVK
ncbi:FecR domain-containing protein [Reichenbachiella sp. MALMAid0571]|uniref:FecR family protein n=1 Tax=Reichenbachiella sp. MALMAid0571 TaxID=3143939 RepID=UPI0032DF47CE